MAARAQVIETEELKTGTFEMPRQTKYTLTGAVKQTPQNSVAGRAKMVYPIKEDEQVAAFIGVFENKIKTAKTDRMLRSALCNRAWILASLNSGLRNSDVVSRRWMDFYYPDWKFREGVRIQEQKTGKFATYALNAYTKRALEEYRAFMAEHNLLDYDGYVFTTFRTSSYHIGIDNCNMIVKAAAKEVGIRRNVGTHSLRKTFGYHFLTQNRGDAYALATLQKLFRHSSPSITLAYCGIDEEEMGKVYAQMGEYFAQFA